MHNFKQHIFKALCLLVLLCTLQQATAQERRVVLQAFWWDYWHNNYQANWSNYLTELAPRLKAMGIDAIWIPPSVKNGFTYGVGYAPFDHYDLGDKFQKGDVKTRLGTKDDLLRMIAVMHANGIDVIQDVVPNHVIGAGSDNGGGGQDPSAWADQWKNFRYTSWLTPATDQTLADYTLRTGRFYKNWQNFHPNPDNNCTTGDICQQMFGPDISYSDNSHGNSSNLNNNPLQTGGTNNGYMRRGMREWLIWYKKQTGFDGVRLDAVKHYDFRAGEDFLFNLQNNAGWASGGSTMFAVGEYVGSGSQLDTWADAAPTGVNTGGMNGRSGTFDFGLRGWSDGLAGITFQGGGINLGNVISGQQSSRGRTVPFVNNHDTFRPILLTNGNFSKPLGDNSGWRTGDELAPHVDPRDPRLSVAYAVMMAVDGSPQIFIEDLFDLGTEGNRYTHDPKNPASLKVRSDLENLIWCRQNLGFFDAGANYLVRWQAADALVIERQNRALIATNDNWNTWQNLTGVQTAFADGTQLKDYSGANGTAVRTVYGGGKVDISIPPCDGTALQGRRGYAVWAPVGQDGDTYTPQRKAPQAGVFTTTQEWEMANDLGDSHCSSLGQGGALPANSTVSRLVGKVYAAAGTNITIEGFPELNANQVVYSIHDLNGTQVFSATNPANANLTTSNVYAVPTTGWYALKVRHNTATQPAMRTWVKATYTAPTTITDAMGTAANNNVAIWTGAFSNDWTECRNWEQAKMPNATTDVLIPSFNNTNIINVTGNLVARNIIVEAGNSINITGTGSVTANGNITLQGNITNAGTLTATGDLLVAGGVAQTISGAGNVSIAGNMTVNKSANGLTITSSNQFTVIGNFTQTLGDVTFDNATQNFNLGGNFIVNAGNFTHPSGKVVFNGSNGLQTLQATTAIGFASLQINKTAGANRDVRLISTNISTSVTTQITAGDLDLNGNQLNLTTGTLQEDLTNSHVVTDRTGIGFVLLNGIFVDNTTNVNTSINGLGIGLQNGVAENIGFNIRRYHNLVAGSMTRRRFELQEFGLGNFTNGNIRIWYAAEDLIGVAAPEASFRVNEYTAPNTFVDLAGTIDVPNKNISKTGGITVPQAETRNFTVGFSTSDITVTASQTAINENGGTTTFVFSRGTSTTGDLTVNFTYAGSAALTTNYTVSGAATYTGGNGTVVIPNGQSTANLTITTVNDQIQNADRNITINLAAGTYTIGTPNNAALTLTNDDIAGATFSKVALNTTRYGGTDTYTYRLNSQPTADVTINLASDNTVGGGTVAPATLTFTSANWNTPQNVTVTGANGGSGTVNYNITSSAASADAFYNGLAINNLPATNIDQTPVITIAAGTTAAEPSTNGTFNISLSVARSVPTTVNITVSGTATGGGTDYTLANGTNTSAVSATQFTFAAGQTSGTLAVNVANDALSESREFVIVTLANGTGYTVGVANQATLTLNDDESLTLLDGVISPNEYGDHSNGQNAALLQGGNSVSAGSQDWYMTWDNNNLYVGITTANINEGMVLYLAKNPSNPINGGTNADGSNQSFNNYDNTNFAELPFRADLVLYLKNGYHEYRTANGSNGWSSQTANTLATGFNSNGNIREFILPWSTVGGMPSSMAFFGYIAYNGGVYGQTPAENAGESIGLTARYEFYHSVPNLATDKPFARKSYVYNSGSSKTLNLPAYITNNNLVVHDFTMNTTSQTLTRATTGSWTVNGTMNLLNGTVDFSNSSLGTNINALNISGASATLNCSAATAPVTITTFTQSNGTVTLSSDAGSGLRVLGNWNKTGGTFTANSRTVSFEGSVLQTLTHNSGNFAGITLNNPAGLELQNSITALGTVTLQNGKLNVLTFDLNLGATGTLVENRANNHLVIGTTGKIVATTRSFNTSSIATDIAGLGLALQDGVGTVNITTINRRFNSIASNSIKKHFEIIGATPSNATVRIYWASDELVGTNVLGTNTVVATTDLTTVNSLASTRDVANRFAQTTGVNSFANYWTLGNATISFTPPSGGTDARITIIGTGFTPTSTVAINGTPARRIWYYSPTQIIAQVGNGTTTGKVSVDGVQSTTDFTVIPCAVPTGVSAVTGTGANAAITVNWTNPGAVNRVDVLYRLTGTTLPATEFTRVNTGQTAAGARTFSITGLNAGVQYDVFVQIRCDGTTWSNWVSAGTATSSAGLTCTRPTISSPANNSTLAALQANLTWSAVTNATNYQVFTVEVDAGLQPVGGTSVVTTVSTPSATVNFPKPSTKYRVWVRANCGTAGFGEYSDNFYVTTGAVTACLPPSTFPAVTYAAGAGNLADATLSWSGASGTSGSPAYEVHLMLPDGTIHSRNTDATTMTWAGLNGNQNYQYRVRTFCANGNASAFSAWQSFTVPNTYGSCGTAITALNVSNAKSWGVKLDWLPNNGGTNNPESNGRSYWVQYWNNTNAGVIYTVQTDSSKIQLLVGTHQGLLTGETYTSRVWYLCNGTLQAVSGTQNFQLVGSLSDKSVVAFPHKESELGLTIYPNPAKQVAVISYHSSMSSTKPIELVVVDALGREVYRETSQSQSLHTNLNVSRLAAGVYLIKVQDGEQTATKRLVVE